MDILAGIWDFLGTLGICLGIFIGLLAASIPFLFWAGILRVITVQEATYVAFKQQGRFVYGAMEFEGHHLEPDGTVALGPGPNEHGSCNWIWRWGGWVFYVYPFVEPAEYSDYNDPNDGFGKGIYVRLGDVASNPFTSVAETTEPAVPGEESGSVGVSVSFTSKMRVVNPQKFLFISPKNVIKEAVEDRQDGSLRALIFAGSVSDIQSAKGNGSALWERLGPPNLAHPGNLDLRGSFDEAKNDWGLEIVPNSIIVKDVKLDDDYQKAKKAKSQQGLVAQGEAARLFDPITLAMDAWVGARRNTQVNPPETLAQARSRLVNTPEYAEREKEFTLLRSKALAGAGYVVNENKYDVQGGDIAGAIAIADAFGLNRNRQRNNPGGGQPNQGGNP